MRQVCGCVSGCEGAYMNPLLRYPGQLSCSPPRAGLLRTIILVVISTCRSTLRPGDVGHSHWMLPVLAPLHRAFLCVQAPAESLWREVCLFRERAPLFQRQGGVVLQLRNQVALGCSPASLPTYCASSGMSLNVSEHQSSHLWNGDPDNLSRCW